MDLGRKIREVKKENFFEIVNPEEKIKFLLRYAILAPSTHNSQPIEENRALISLDEKLVPNYNLPEEAQKRKESVSNFKKIFGP